MQVQYRKRSTQHPRPPIRRSPYSSFLSSSTGTITTIFVNGRTYCPHNVLIFTFLVFPSCPGNVLMILPIVPLSSHCIFVDICYRVVNFYIASFGMPFFFSKLMTGKRLCSTFSKMNPRVFEQIQLCALGFWFL